MLVLTWQGWLTFQVRAASIFALGTLLNVGFDSARDEECDDDDDEKKVKAEISIVKSLLNVVSDGSPLVRTEIAVGMHQLVIFLQLIYIMC